METVRKHLVLEFATEGGNNITLKVLKPLEGLSGAEIKSAMDKIVETGAYGMASPASAVVGAQYDIREIETIDLN